MKTQYAKTYAIQGMLILFIYSFLFLSLLFLTLMFFIFYHQGTSGQEFNAWIEPEAKAESWLELALLS